MMKRKFIHKQKFRNRHRARELAVQFLYSLDLNPEQDFNSALDLFLNIDEISLNEPDEVKDYCKELVNDVTERSNVNVSIAAHNDFGAVFFAGGKHKLGIFSRTCAIAEGFIIKKLPAQSAFAEAALLANDFGTQNSARFVNGVLARVYKLFNKDSGENV